MYKSPLPLAKFFVGAATIVRLIRGVQTESSAVPRGSASLISGKCVHCRRLDLPSHLRLTIRGRGQRHSIQPRCREQVPYHRAPLTLDHSQLIIPEPLGPRIDMAVVALVRLLGWTWQTGDKNTPCFNVFKPRLDSGPWRASHM